MATFENSPRLKNIMQFMTGIQVVYPNGYCCYLDETFYGPYLQHIIPYIDSPKEIEITMNLFFDELHRLNMVPISILILINSYIKNRCWEQYSPSST